MKKVSIILHLLALIGGAATLLVTGNAVSVHDSDRELISQTSEKLAAVGNELEKFRVQAAGDLARQKRRLDEVNEQIELTLRKKEQGARDLEQLKEGIEEGERGISETNRQKDEVMQEQANAEEGIARTEESLMVLRQEIPRLEQAARDEDAQAEDFRVAIAKLSSKLEVFSQITEVFKAHHDRTMSSLRTYARERPWLEPGERITLQLQGLDLKSGYVALSKGGNAGIRGGMIFEVAVGKDEICKLRVKQVFRLHALAEVIPLQGRPLELEGLKTVDLVVL